MFKRLYLITIAVLVACVLDVHTAGAQSGRWVSNPDGILSSATVAQIDGLCAELATKHLAQVAVLVLDNVPEDQLDLFAHRQLNQLGVGEKDRDNGLIISVVRQQRDIQFETGYGLEGVLPDALCKRIQTVYMIGPLGAGDFDKGVLDGVTAVYNVLMDNTEELGALTDARNADDKFLLLKAFGALALFILVIVLLGRGGGGMGGFLLGTLLGGMGRGGGGGGFGGGGSGGFGGGFGGGMSGGGGARSGF